MSSQPLRPYQQKGLAEFWSAVDSGYRRIVYAGPTGSGKTRQAVEMIFEAISRRWPVIIYTNRIMLARQISRVLTDHGIIHGLRMAGEPTRLLEPIQISMIPTEINRTLKQKKWDLHPAKLVITDEVHNNNSGGIRKLKVCHLAQGAVDVGLTATPIGLGDYDHMIVAGINSQLRAGGYLVPCETHSINEPDMKGVKRMTSGEYEIKGLVHRMMNQQIVGSIIPNWLINNPNMDPSICFGPDVPSSRWLCDYFCANGIPAAHIDGESVRWNGQDYSGTTIRDEVMAASREGSVKMLCNRYVLREGVDAPWLVCGVSATVYGSLTTFLQSGGRLLRPHPGKTRAIWQCHSGSWWRWGSLNEDRQFELGKTSRMYEKERLERFRESPEREPIRCPRCGGVRSTGPKCPFCGKEHVRSVRVVLMEDGRLVKRLGSVHKRVRKVDDPVKAWTGMYFRALQGRGLMNFNQLRGMFGKEYPRYQICYQGGKTVVVDKHDFSSNVLPYAPPPGSSDWGKFVRYVKGDQLQRSVQNAGS